MKTFFLGLTLALATGTYFEARADDTDGSRSLWFTTVRQDTCDYWTSVRVDGRTLYGCMMSPRRAETPDAYSLDRTLDRIDARLRDMETRVQALEQKP